MSGKSQKELGEETAKKGNPAAPNSSFKSEKDKKDYNDGYAKGKKG